MLPQPITSKKLFLAGETREIIGHQPYRDLGIHSTSSAHCWEFGTMIQQSPVVDQCINLENGNGLL
jgi:hypothetical protein